MFHVAVVSLISRGLGRQTSCLGLPPMHAALELIILLADGGLAG